MGTAVPQDLIPSTGDATTLIPIPVISTSVISITLVYASAPRMVHEMALRVEQGCTASQALERSAMLQDVPAEQLKTLQLGVWGRKAPGTQVLRANDRIEISRPLTVDPKVARRERFVRQGAKTAGLFAKRRAGAKAGY
jgi:putative ubiquitin-RnfH superfamily antitoxin RatB of RatAB toxin-antitoxin module